LDAKSGKTPLNRRLTRLHAEEGLEQEIAERTEFWQKDGGRKMKVKSDRAPGRLYISAPNISAKLPRIAAKEHKSDQPQNTPNTPTRT